MRKNWTEEFSTVAIGEQSERQIASSAEEDLLKMELNDNLHKIDVDNKENPITLVQ